MLILLYIYTVSTLISFSLAMYDIVTGVREDIRLIKKYPTYVPEWTYLSASLVLITTFIPVINSILVIVLLYEHNQWIGKFLNTPIAKR